MMPNGVDRLNESEGKDELVGERNEGEEFDDEILPIKYTVPN